jgi:Protein of unknown function (DUF3617)
MVRGLFHHLPIDPTETASPSYCAPLSTPNFVMLRTKFFMALLAVGHGLSAQAADLVKPGKWALQTQVSADGQRWQVTEHPPACVSPEQAMTWEQNARRQIDALGCNVQQLSVGAGRIRGALACPASGPIRILVEGVYSHDAFQADLKAEGLAGQVMAKWNGQRVGNCP